MADDRDLKADRTESFAVVAGASIGSHDDHFRIRRKLAHGFGGLSGTQYRHYLQGGKPCGDPCCLAFQQVLCLCSRAVVAVLLRERPRLRNSVDQVELKTKSTGPFGSPIRGGAADH